MDEGKKRVRKRKRPIATKGTTAPRFQVPPLSVFAWFVGLVEGEASFLRPSPSRPRNPKLEIEMTDEVIIRKVAALLGVKYRIRDREKANTKVAYHVRIVGRRAVQLMWSIRPYMSPRRQAQISRAVQCFVDRGPDWHPDTFGMYEFPPLCADVLCTKTRSARSPYCSEHHRQYKERHAKTRQ